MRNWIIGAAAALAAVAAPGVAAAQGTGYVGLDYSSSEFSGATDEVDSWGGHGSVAFAGSGSIVFELDGAIRTTDDSGPGDDDTAFGVVGHVMSRNDDHMIGGALGIVSSDDSETWIAALEANKYVGMWTFAGDLFYGNNDDAETDGLGANVEVRVFPTDNFRLNGNIGLASVDDGGAGDDEDVTILGAGGEFQFTGAPVSIGANYTNFDFDGGDVDVWTVVLRWNFGGTTLRDRDRNGASEGDLLGLGSAFIS